MNEIERVRKEIVNIIYDLLGGDSDFDKQGGYYPCADLADEKAEQILKIKGLVVLADDQTLPIENSDVEAMYAGIFNVCYPSIAGAYDVLATERIASAMKVYKKRLLKAGCRKVVDG